MRYERCVADLEGGTRGFAFASGMAATATVLELLDAGSHVIAMRRSVRRHATGCSSACAGAARARRSPSSICATRGARGARCGPNTRMIWVETPTNPLLKLVDLEAVAAIARKRGLISVCDNTFATPVRAAPARARLRHRRAFDDQVSQRPFGLVGGIGVVAATTGSCAEQLAFLQNAVGAIAGPVRLVPGVARHQDAARCAWSAHCANALAIARLAGGAPARSSACYYPGLASHPQHALAKRQMRGFGGMIVDRSERRLAGARRFLERCQLFALAESLGGVESLIEHPAIMTHASLPAAMRASLGIGDGLVRLSVGIEDVSDLIAELRTALS